MWKAVKTRLRGNAVTGRPYHFAAKAYHTARYSAKELMGLRLHPRDEFERLYEEDPDPWGYVGDAVSEERKRLLLARVAEEPPQQLLEIGCASGWLTADLARIATSTLAVDISERAIARARARCAGFLQLSFARIDLLEEPLPGRFDTVMCAGVLVYLPWRSHHLVRDRIVGALLAGGRLLLEHTRDRFPGGLAGSTIHALYAGNPRLELLSRERRDIYEVLVLRRR